MHTTIRTRALAMTIGLPVVLSITSVGAQTRPTLICFDSSGPSVAFPPLKTFGVTASQPGVVLTMPLGHFAGSTRSLPE